MLSTAKLKEEINFSRDALLNAIVQSKDRAEVGQRNADRLAYLNKDLQKDKAQIQEIKQMINYLVKVYKNIEQYLIDKKQSSMETLKLAVEKAGLIVPDADTEGISLSVLDKTAKVVNKYGQDINLREGSAFRTVMGALMKYTLIKHQPDCIQAIFLDELFSTLSDASSASMREYIEAITQDILVVGIEQRSIMFEGMEKTTYRVSKGADKKTVVKKED